MPWGEIGAFLLFLTAVFIFGNLWFRFIEAILSRIKQIFTHHKKPLFLLNLALGYIMTVSECVSCERSQDTDGRNPCGPAPVFADPPWI